MLQDMRKGLSRQMHAQATMQMLPTFICSMPDGTGKAACPGDRPLCYLQPHMPHGTWPWGAGEGCTDFWSMHCPCTASASPWCRARGQELVLLAPVVVSGSQEPPPWVGDCPWDRLRGRL